MFLASLCFTKTHLNPVRMFAELSALVSFTIIFIGSITKMPIIEAPWDVGGDEKVPLNLERNENVQVSHLLPHAGVVICVASRQQR